MIGKKNSKLIIGLTAVAIIIAAGILIYKNTRPNNKNLPSSENFLEQELIFETISKESLGGQKERGNYVIKNNRKWKNLWNVAQTKSPKPDLPDIDFDSEMIIAVFQGTYPTGGYGIKITKIIEKENSVDVFIEEKAPPFGTIVSMAFTQPYHIIKTKRVDKEVVFKE